MSDPYRIGGPSEPRPAGHAATRQGLLRPVLWLALIVSAAANGVSSSVGGNPIVGGGFGLATLACATALVVHHYRRRRR